MLASASAGRLKVLRQAGVDPLVVVSGVNKANVNGISSTGRQPRITCSARNNASDASSCSTSRLTAGQVQSSGAARMMVPASRNAPGMRCPSWSSNRYDGASRLWVPALPIRIRSSQ